MEFIYQYDIVYNFVRNYTTTAHTQVWNIPDDTDPDLFSYEPDQNKGRCKKIVVSKVKILIIH